MDTRWRLSSRGLSSTRRRSDRFCQLVADGFSGRQPLDYAEPVAFQLLYLQSLGQDVVERLAQEMVAHPAHGQRLQEALDRTNDPIRTSDVLY